MYSHLRNIIFIDISGQQNSDNLLIGSSNISDNENCNTFVKLQHFKYKAIKIIFAQIISLVYIIFIIIIRMTCLDHFMICTQILYFCLHIFWL
jgi:hypothetical protein